MYYAASGHIHPDIIKIYLLFQRQIYKHKLRKLYIINHKDVSYKKNFEKVFGKVLNKIKRIF